MKSADAIVITFFNPGEEHYVYAFVYDHLSRLKGAKLEVGGVIDNRYHTAYTYDKNGNMPTLIRYGKTDGANYGIVDELSAVYNGNQLKSVEDASDMVSHHESGDFKDFSTETTEYTYNANGALTRDLNKGVSSISYNSLNLPRQIDIKSPFAEARNSYLYSAEGASCG